MHSLALYLLFLIIPFDSFKRFCVVGPSIVGSSLHHCYLHTFLTKLFNLWRRILNTHPSQYMINLVNYFDRSVVFPINISDHSDIADILWKTVVLNTNIILHITLPCDSPHMKITRYNWMLFMMSMMWYLYNTITSNTRTPRCKIFIDSSTDVVFFTRKSVLSDHLRVVIIAYKYYTYTVKPAHAVTSIKQSPLLNSHLY